jgi:hypothetical protein
VRETNELSGDMIFSDWAHQLLEIQKLAENKENQVVETTLMLRPEVAKSIWYAWRFTGDPVWQERAWSLFQASEKHFKATGGYYARSDAKDSGSAKHNSK